MNEESEVKDIEWLKREIHKELESWHGVEGGIDGDGINEIMLLINQLDEPNTLSEYWIEQKSIDTHVDTLNGEVQVTFRLDDLQNLLVPKPELPVIPNYVAKWISVHHERFDLYPALRRLEEGSTRDYDAYKWYRRNTHTFVNAYLTGKYEVEEEQRYYVKIMDKYLTDKGLGIGTTFDVLYTSGEKMGYQQRFTEQEIKNFDPRYWPFAVKVEEMEE